MPCNHGLFTLPLLFHSTFPYKIVFFSFDAFSSDLLCLSPLHQPLARAGPPCSPSFPSFTAWRIWRGSQEAQLCTFTGLHWVLQASLSRRGLVLAVRCDTQLQSCFKALCFSLTFWPEVFQTCAVMDMAVFLVPDFLHTLCSAITVLIYF